MATKWYYTGVFILNHKETQSTKLSLEFDTYSF